MKVKVNVSNSNYSAFLQEEFRKKEGLETRFNSIYEFRVLQCFDPMFWDEIRAMIEYVKKNKVCKTNDDVRFRDCDLTIVQKIDKMTVLQSSAIMVETR